MQIWQFLEFHYLVLNKAENFVSYPLLGREHINDWLMTGFGLAPTLSDKIVWYKKFGLDIYNFPAYIGYKGGQPQIST